MEMASEAGRPQRKRVKKLTDEQIHAILQSESDSSGVDDPDFVNEDFELVKSPKRAQRATLPVTVEETPVVLPSSLPQVLDNDLRAVAVLKPSSTTANAQAAPTEDNGQRYKCCVTGCISGNLSDKDGLWLFPFPKSSTTLEAWERQLTIDREHNRPLSPRVCFRHFDKADFIRKQQRFVGLCDGAVPKTLANTVRPKPLPQPKQRRVELIPSPLRPPLRPPPQVVRLMPITSRLGSPGHPGLPGVPRAPVPQGPVRPAFPQPQTLGRASAAPEEPTSNGTILPDVPLFVHDRVKQDPERPSQKAVSYGKDGFVVTQQAELATDNALEMMEIKIEPIDQLPEEEAGDGPMYSMTLEDIQEELPWVVPDNSWKSEMDGDSLVIAKDVDGWTRVVKKVVIKDGLNVAVYVGSKQVDKFDRVTLASADDLRVILEQVEKLQ